MRGGNTPADAHICRTYPVPRSIALALPAFLQASLFCVSVGSSWCSFMSLLTLPIHLSLSIPSKRHRCNCFLFATFFFFFSFILSHFYVGSMYDDIRLHVARSYTSSADSPFSLMSSFTLSNHLLLGLPLFLLPCTFITIALLPT